jgi:CDP-4-dehydro-6-deoxyglucose reductase/ferredoxin-NAD(P)+ reductase (naphthalene dioxygenase ferredoxin-specific)
MSEIGARVVAIEPATHDIRILRLRPDRAFEFRAGQYARLRFHGHAPRDYSIASVPGSEHVEFHIRDIGTGASAHACRDLKPGDQVWLEGPFGDAVLDESSTRPLLAIAGGSGLAPMGSIVETALARSPQREVLLYFGVRSDRDLYGRPRFDALAARHPNFRFVPVLSTHDAPSRHRTGLVGDAVAADHRDLSRFDAYLAGPPAMVAHARDLLLGRGLPPDRLFADLSPLTPSPVS